MAWKKRKSRKYIPRNEFRRNLSKSAQAHYNYVFGETDTHYKSLGLTTHPRNDIPHYELTKNPNPNDKRTSFLQLKVLNTNKKYIVYLDGETHDLFRSEKKEEVFKLVEKFLKK